ncbi:hypothetical protein F5890DRAFT_1470591 [Lentinula detonsa]|uniref:Uncharacterized protein n=1 Tax=Lentinula detonsa TaxID=2804962 RepID=A0AA38Q975_9AGAR|nr:hypothetical protein F5890DRAFT_1470591 [Lentinula detonsa]
MPVDASGSDRLNMRSVKENVNGVNGNSGANGAHSQTNGAPSNSGTNGVHSNSGTNGVHSNSGTNGVHSNSGTNGVHSNSGTNGVHSNSGTNGAHSNLEQSTDSDDDPRVTITFLDAAAGTSASADPVEPRRVVRRISEHMSTVLPRWPRGDGFRFTNDYILEDVEAVFRIQVTADGSTHNHTIPRDPHPPHP